MGNLRLVLINIKKNIKNEKQLRSSFIISIIGMCLNNIAFLVIWYYFGKTVGSLNGWEPIDVFGLYGINSTAFGIIMTFLAGIYDIPNYITTGNFDKYLLSPKSVLLKVSTSKITTSAIGDLVFGIICLIIFIINKKLSIIKILLAILLIITSGIIFYSFSLVCMTISFYLMDGHNVSEGLYGMFLSDSLCHGGAFTGVLRIIFTFIVPSLLIGVIPVELINNFSINTFILILGLAIFWLVISIIFFNKSLRKYESNNFFGFGC